MNVGCHVSIAGGVQNAPQNAHDAGCEVMQIFTRPPAGGRASPLTSAAVAEFKLKAESYGLRAVYVHAPYFINFASSSNRIRYGSISSIKQELERASLLGAKYVMTHLGSFKDLGEEESIKKTIEGLQKVFEGYTGSAKLLIENSAGSGSVIGSSFKQIGQILSGAKSALGGLKDNLAGICLDTQHSFASGYNWRDDFTGALKELEKHIGLANIKLIHANDSMSECGSHVDRHEHIGAGKIGMDGFKNLVAFAKKNKIDMICETKSPGVTEDIKTLKSLRD